MSAFKVLLHILAVLFLWSSTSAENLPSYCKNEKLSSKKGSISTASIVRPAVYCHRWVITALALETITVSFSEINLGSASYNGCQGNSLKIGGVRQISLCGLPTPYVYKTISGIVEITYMQNSSAADVGFSAEYISGYYKLPGKNNCQSDETQCKNGYCILSSWRCNGANECADTSDELDCEPSTTAVPELICQTDQLKCRSAESNQNICLDQSKRCDGRKDCSQSEDEDIYLCGDKITTFPTKMTCTNGQILCRPIWKPSKDMCVDANFKCDGKIQCIGEEDEDPSLCGYSTTTDQIKCRDDQIMCRSSSDYRLTCIDDFKKCDGIEDCLNREDEMFCRDSQSCNRYIEIDNLHPYGYISSPRYPHIYPDNIDCTWHFHSQTNDRIQLRFRSFHLQDKSETDYVSVFNGPNTYTKHINTYYGKHMPPLVIESTSSHMTVVFHADSSISGKGFNLTYQNKGSCYPGQTKCGKENDCYNNSYRCNGIWDCPRTGFDELHCYYCKGNQYTCGPRINQCYDGKQRCNGVSHCTNMMDELYCTSMQCGPHNGTFLCDNGRCIYESWKCDKTNDCVDNSDERHCSHSTNLIKIAAVCGALICGLLLVVAFGCTCKLYNLRVNGHRHRHETPLSRLYSEFMRRRAPPPYHEAMLTSRPYDDVRRDYLEHLQQNGARPPSRRGRRNRNRNQNQNTDTQGQNETESQNATNGTENAEPLQDNPPEETQNSVNTELERHNSTSLLLPESSCSESESDMENQIESVQVSISEENIVTAAYSRGSSINKSDSDSENNGLPTNETHPELDSQSLDVCSVDATIASCDSVDDSDKPIDVLVVGSITHIHRQGSEESLNSIESGDHSYGEFTIAEM